MELETRSPRAAGCGAAWGGPGRGVPGRAGAGVSPSGLGRPPPRPPPPQCPLPTASSMPPPRCGGRLGPRKHATRVRIGRGNPFRVSGTVRKAARFARGWPGWGGAGLDGDEGGSVLPAAGCREWRLPRALPTLPWAHATPPVGGCPCSRVSRLAAEAKGGLGCQNRQPATHASSRAAVPQPRVL